MKLFNLLIYFAETLFNAFFEHIHLIMSHNLLNLLEAESHKSKLANDYDGNHLFLAVIPVLTVLFSDFRNNKFNFIVITQRSYRNITN